MTNQKSFKLSQVNEVLKMTIISEEKQEELDQKYIALSKMTKVSEETIQITKYRQMIQQLQQKLSKEQEISFILKHYFNKIQKVLYNATTDIFHQQKINYEQLELHLRQILRRLQDINNNKLSAPPKVYKKSNVKCFKVIPQ